jgi:hypothetical protein
VNAGPFLVFEVFLSSSRCPVDRLPAFRKASLVAGLQCLLLYNKFEWNITNRLSLFR